MNDKILALIGRRHDSKQAKAVVGLAKQVGFKNISVDMMIGLPKQTMADVKKMTKFLIKSGVSHVSCYSLILEKGTVMYDKVKVGALTVPSEDETVEMYNFVYDTLSKAGLKRYEVSNFALLDYESKHNQNYWKLGEYLAFGIGGHSYMNDTRFANEVFYPKAIFGDKVIAVRVERDDPNFCSALSDEQLHHISETALDDFEGFDYKISASNLDELEDAIAELSSCI